jgi:hypothetical protein
LQALSADISDNKFEIMSVNKGLKLYIFNFNSANTALRFILDVYLQCLRVKVTSRLCFGAAYLHACV